MKKSTICLLFIIFATILSKDIAAQEVSTHLDANIIYITDGDMMYYNDDYNMNFTVSGSFNTVNCVEPYSPGNYYIELYESGNETAISTLLSDNNGSGISSYQTLNYFVPIGPDSTITWRVKYHESTGIFGCKKWIYSNWFTGTTMPIMPPVNITASNMSSFDSIFISWEKGTKIPDENIHYIIYRSFTPDPAQAKAIDTVNGDEFEYTDINVTPNYSYYYWVTTYTSKWGGHESPILNPVTGKTKRKNIAATDGLYTNRVKIEWDDLSDIAEEIRIERSVPEDTTKEELAILSKFATAYTDNEAIPGYSYIYFVTPVHSERNFSHISDAGYIKPNGIIKGTVKSVVGAGVSGVSVCARRLTLDFPAGVSSVPPDGYCDITDADGYFEIRNIYYFDEAEFEVIPSKVSSNGAHIFSPDTTSRILDINSKISSGVNFTDESVFTVSGKVKYPDDVGCGVSDVEIMVNGDRRGIKTNNNGDWNCSIQEEGVYTFTPKFLHHNFIRVDDSKDSTITVNGDVENIDFYDIQVDSIEVIVQNGCGEPVADSAQISVISSGGCFNKTFYTDPNGLITIPNLPARKYSVQVNKLFNPVSSNIFSQIGNKSVEINLTIRDTSEVYIKRDSVRITPADTLYLPNDSIDFIVADTVTSEVIDTIREVVIPKAEFIYHSPLKIDAKFGDSGAEILTCGDDNLIIMEQGASYQLNFSVSESLGECQVNEGVLRIFDFISDRGDEPIEIPIKDGTATYFIDAGIPETAKSSAHNHEKLLYVIPEVGFADAEPIDYWILVTGVKTYAPSFVTRSPEFPMLILHDPPGDNSYAYVESGTQVSKFMTQEILVGGEAGIYANAVLGTKIETPLTKHGVGMEFKLSAMAGRDNYNRQGWESTVTFTEEFSTSDLENLVGSDGDVYIGASYNQEFSIGERISFNRNTCEIETDSVPTIDLTGFETTFIYTEKHIRSTLIPTLGKLRATIINGKRESELSEEERLNAYQLQWDSLHWENVLAKNKANRDSNSIFEKNISFSAGAKYKNQYTSSRSSSESYEYIAFVDIGISIGTKIIDEWGLWYDSEFGVAAKFRWHESINKGSDKTSDFKVGYVLDDNDIGDFFSVDIKEDTAFNVPAFDLLLGTTSCPNEQSTQPRDDARIVVENPQINNVPIDGKAVFTFGLINESQSGETREYHVRVISTTNPDGAIIKLGGQQINNTHASYFLDFNQTASVALTVEKGPFATNYDSIGIMMYPPCEYDLWQDNGEINSGDTAWIFVNFESECSSVTLLNPGDGWLVNKKNNDILPVTFTGYDLNNTQMENITLQYKREGQGWLDAVIIDTSDITENFYDYDFNVANLPDGNYRLRAKTYCGNDGGFSYSSEQKGIIDRSSIAPFGIPSPSDGYLRFGQEISVVFDKNINCSFESYDHALSQANIKLYMEDSTEIPITVECSGDRIILVPEQNLFEHLNLKGIKLFAVVEGIQDENYNVQEYPTIWSFMVNVSPVEWNPGNINISTQVSNEIIINANLDNSALISKSFTISDWPDWLTPSVTSSSILSGNNYTIQLKVADNLIPGIYTGQVTALIDGIEEILDVTLELYAKEVSWNFNKTDFEYNMNITAQFSTDENDLNLSKDCRDKIAAYIDGELRGTGDLTYVPELNKYAAFINVFSNDALAKNGSFFEAEDYLDDLSVQNINITDNGQESAAVRLKKDDWIEFDIYATKTGTFDIEFRLAGNESGKTAEVLIDGVSKTTFTVTNTGDLSNYTTITTSLELTKGEHVIRIHSVDARFDLNWFNFPEYHVRDLHSSEVIKFRMWQGLEGIELGAIEELTFYSDGVVGNAENPFILHPSGKIQKIALAKGWTWISVNKENMDMSVDKVFESITSPNSFNEILLKSQFAQSQYAPNIGWGGELMEINPKYGYMIHLDTHDDTLNLVGNKPEEDITIALNPKWNWIGYPKQDMTGINELLSEYDATAGDIIKSQDEYAEYNENISSWLGNLSFFKPGKGYKLFVSNPGHLNIEKSDNLDKLNSNYEYNMTLTGIVNIESMPAFNDYRLQAFVNNQLRGEVPLRFNVNLNKYMAFAMIYGDRGDIGDTVKVILWDEKNQKEIGLTYSTIDFGIDRITGTISNPIIFSILDKDRNLFNDQSASFVIYPNPFADRAVISYNLPKKSKVLLKVTNINGAEISRIIDNIQEAGHYNYVFDASNLATGVYYCTLQTKNFIETKKVILIDY